MTHRFEKIGRETSLSDKCYLALIEFIEQAPIHDNKMPSEEDLSEMLGVSRTTVREAMRQLVAEGFLTRIPGQGHYAHPSVSKLKNRIDLFPDIYRLLDKYYGNATLAITDVAVCSPSEECRECFKKEGDNVDEVYYMRWVYSANGNPKFVGLLEFPVQYIVKPLEDLESVKGLPEFSTQYMENLITHCTMTLNVCENSEASRILGQTDKCALSWRESIYNLDDLLVGFGKIYFSPDEIGLTINAALTRNIL
mgnify:CR=1 FL=1